jgi:nickel/cobalt transporter (NiCoT) family protein
MSVQLTGRLRAARSALSPAEWARLSGMTVFIMALNMLGWGIFAFAVRPHHFRYTGLGIGLGVALTAWTLGARHAFDADHISAIDNTTRKLMGEGRRPLGVGCFFSLGHSTIVLALALVLALGVRSAGPQITGAGSTLHEVGGVLGTSISGAFLYAIAAINLAVLLGIVRAFARLRGGVAPDELELDRLLERRGLITRLLGGLSRRVVRSWHAYPLGLLFGLGFDTASEVALLVIAAGAASTGLPVYAILSLPILFAAGMTLLDTIDGSFMNFAYGWAFSKPARKLYYNLTITGLSVAVALLVGTTELLSIATQRFGLHGAFWQWVAEIDLNTVGYVIVGLFVLTWVLALAIWRLGRIEERWEASVRSSSA